MLLDILLSELAFLNDNLSLRNKRLINLCELINEKKIIEFFSSVNNYSHTQNKVSILYMELCITFENNILLITSNDYSLECIGKFNDGEWTFNICIILENEIVEQTELNIHKLKLLEYI